MPEHRARQHHRERLTEALKEEIASLVQEELADPRIGLVTVTEVVLAADGKSARVFVVVEGESDERQQQQTLAGLAAATGYIRHEVAERLGLRHAPEFSFQVDSSEQYEARIDQLLRRIVKDRR